TTGMGPSRIRVRPWESVKLMVTMPWEYYRLISTAMAGLTFMLPAIRLPAFFTRTIRTEPLGILASLLEVPSMKTEKLRQAWVSQRQTTTTTAILIWLRPTSPMTARTSTSTPVMELSRTVSFVPGLDSDAAFWGGEFSFWIMTMTVGATSSWSTGISRLKWMYPELTLDTSSQNYSIITCKMASSRMCPGSRVQGWRPCLPAVGLQWPILGTTAAWLLQSMR